MSAPPDDDPPTSQPDPNRLSTSTVQPPDPASSSSSSFSSDIEPLLPTTTTPHTKPHLPLPTLLRLGTLWLGYQYYWILVLIIIAPSHIRSIVGDTQKGRALALINLISGFVNLFLALIVGALNDRFQSRWGKRKPWIAGGVVGMCGCLVMLRGNEPLWVYAVGYALLTASTVVASVPFNGLVADVTPGEQKGRVSSILGSMNLLGYLLGAVTGVFADTIGLQAVYAIMICVVLGTSAITILGVEEPEENFREEILEPFHLPTLVKATIRPLFVHKDFRLVFYSRFVFQLGIATVQQFLQYWIEDCIHTTLPPKRAVSLALLPLLLISPLSALLIPSKSRKRTVYTSATLFITTSILMTLVRSFPLALLTSALFGTGYGPFISVEFAMLMDVLPRAEDAARDMGLWHASLVLPQVVATPVAGWVRDLVQPVGERWGVECLGYRVIFVVCVGYFLGGVWVTRRIEGVR
ncbi:hypothetical protein HDV00_010568 [Rhizophlyctis rosea]|nr:hypothetical protein HDV00_010568 [Rhizophlyctis rosea]